MKWYIEDKKIKAGMGADKKYHLEIESLDFGTESYTGKHLGDCIAQLLDKRRDIK